MALIYDTLFWVDPQGAPQPWLIERFDMSQDGRQLTLELRKNIKWHDGKPLTAEDVKFTIEFMQKFAHPRFSPRLAQVSNVAIVDAETLKISLARPISTFVYSPLSEIPIIPKHLWGGVTENPYGKPEILRKFNVPELPAGSGPYIFVEYLSGQRYRLKANLDYFKGKPAVDEIVVSIIPNSSARSAALK
jgi:peptide/nickel transport system substrate-binding protein